MNSNTRNDNIVHNTDDAEYKPTAPAPAKKKIQRITENPFTTIKPTYIASQ
ncbi:hypothetical protein A2U01_0092454, partial [Trifolium medium]|nr:hypothetical protein [Trifolium medium]